MIYIKGIPINFDLQRIEDKKLFIRYGDYYSENIKKAEEEKHRNLARYLVTKNTVEGLMGQENFNKLFLVNPSGKELVSTLENILKQIINQYKGCKGIIIGLDKYRDLIEV